MSEESPPPEAPAVKRHLRLVHRFVILMVSLVAVVAIVGVTARYFVASDAGRAFVAARLEGMKLGPVGRLHLEGVKGDLLTDFTVDRITVIDAQGVWLEGRKVHVKWNYRALFGRVFDASLVAVEDLKVIRRPLLTPVPQRDLPVAFKIRRLTTRLESLPAATIERGYFNVEARLDMDRKGGGAGHLDAVSLLHQGDGAKADFSFGRARKLLVSADVVEAEGGAIAGALGLSTAKPFTLHARVGGEGEAGTIDVVARTGKETPLEAKGGWNKAGLSADGRIDLTASKWTTELVSRFGPEISAKARAAQAKAKSTYTVNLEGHSDNLDLTAVGPVRISDRSTSGLTVDFAVDDMSRLQSVMTVGPSRFHGKAVGKFNAFTVSGDVSGRDLALWDYTLATAAGTAEVSLAKREVTIKADITGAGGSGDLLFAKLMGPSPHVVTDMVRLTDQRLLIRSIDAQAAGFEVHGKGDRVPIIGTLNFDGQGRLTNPGAFYEGATGVVEGEWSATNGLNRQWAVTGNVEGKGLVTGLPELDRLLGAAPRLEARAVYEQDARWRVTRSTLTGKASNVRATGFYGPQNALDLDLDWNAKGPFQAGPVEIAGDIGGAGKVSGTIEKPRADLTARIPGIDIGALALNDGRLTLTFLKGDTDYSGTIALAASSPQGPATGRAAFHFPDEGIDLSGIDASAGGVTAKGSLSLRNNQPSRADLAVTVGRGAFLAAGTAQGTVRILDAPGGAQGDINLRVADLQFPDSTLIVKTGTLAGSGPISRMPFTVRGEALQGETPILLNGTGIASQKDMAWTVALSGQGKVDKITLATAEPLTVNFGGPATTANGVITVGGGRGVIALRQEGEAVSGDVRLTGVDISVLQQDLAGRFDATLTASGRGPSLSAQLQANLQRLRSRDGPTDSAIDGTLRATLTGPRLAVDLQVQNQAGLRSTASAVLAAEASASPFRVALDRTKPIEGVFDLDGELQPVWDLFFGGARTLGGHVQAKGNLAGTLNDPQISGQASLTNGRFEDFASGLKLRQVTVRADMQRNAIEVREFTGQDERRGTLTGRGRMSLVSGEDSSFSLQANQFLLVDNDIAEARASGEVEVKRGADGKVALTGRLTIDRADVVADPPTPSGVVPLEVIEINVPPERADYFNAPRSRGPSVRLDVTLNAPRGVFVKGRGLDVELSLNARVQGTTTDPQLTGTARVVRGEYDFAGKRFEFDESGVVYLASTPENIRLDLEARREDPSLTAIVQVKGTAAKPEIELTSTPSLPRDEVLSQVLFGRSAAQLSSIEAAQLAASLAALASGGGFDVIGGIREFMRLDRLAFGGGEASGMTVSVGKYVSDNVYLELTGGGREGGAAQVEWRVRPRLSIVSRTSGTGDTRLSIRWRQDSGKKGKATAPAAQPSQPAPKAK